MTEKDIIFLALCICAKDGLISSEEEVQTLVLFNEASKDNKIPFKKLTKSSYEKIVDEFFSSRSQLEDYIEAVKDSEYLGKILEIAKNAASSDGFDIRENIAYQKTKVILKIE